jgi:hypothetical protein
LWIQLLVIVAISVGIFYAGLGSGQALDCVPGQRDGQCGLVTFIGFMGGAFFGGGFLIASCIAVVGDWVWKRRQERLKRAFEGDE